MWRSPVMHAPHACAHACRCVSPTTTLGGSTLLQLAACSCLGNLSTELLCLLCVLCVLWSSVLADGTEECPTAHHVLSTLQSSLMHHGNAWTHSYSLVDAAPTGIHLGTHACTQHHAARKLRLLQHELRSVAWRCRCSCSEGSTGFSALSCDTRHLHNFPFFTFRSPLASTRGKPQRARMLVRMILLHNGPGNSNTHSA
jgi:hypothetical protein